MPVFLYVLYGSAHYLQVGAVSVLSLVTQGTVASMLANYTVSTTSTATGPVAPGVYVVSQAQYLGLMARAHARSSVRCRVRREPRRENRGHARPTRRSSTRPRRWRSSRASSSSSSAFLASDTS